MAIYFADEDEMPLGCGCAIDLFVVDPGETDLYAQLCAFRLAAESSTKTPSLKITINLTLSTCFK